MKPEHYTVIDIETMPNIDLISRLPGIVKPEYPVREFHSTGGSLKDPVKIMEKRQTYDRKFAAACNKIDVDYNAAKTKQIEKMSLDPLYGRICCIGVKRGDEEKVFIDDVNNDFIERNLIQNACDYIFTYSSIEPVKLATWNGKNFDIPFIYKRAMILGVSIDKHFQIWCWMHNHNDDHRDLMQVWTGYNVNQYQGRKGLGIVSDILLGEKKVDFDVTKISEMIKTPEGRAEVSKYCLQDVRLTYRLLEKFKDYLCGDA